MNANKQEIQKNTKKYYSETPRIHDPFKNGLTC